MPLTIIGLRALEVLDSRGNPTVAVTAELSDGTTAASMVPSGASTGTHEARELRDGDPARYAGKGVLRACANVEGEILAHLRGRAADDHPALDRALIELDGTPGKSRLGANAILAVSCAVARAAAEAQRIPLWRYLSDAFPGRRNPQMPVPMVNILSGGLHAGRNIEFQDYLVIAHGLPDTARAVEAVAAVHRSVEAILRARGITLTGVADEGGWGPHLGSNEEALAILAEAISRAGFTPGRELSIALDVAASHFYRDGEYHLATEARRLTAGEMIDTLARWCGRYPLISIEDGLQEDAWEHWPALTRRLGPGVQVIGDDLFTTNPDRVRRGIELGAANAVLVKMNQIGTLTETFEVIEMAAQAGWRAVISARSGETEDSFLADLAVASGAGQIKVGSITRSERLAKYNRLLAIERESGLPYAKPFNRAD